MRFSEVTRIIIRDNLYSRFRIIFKLDGILKGIPVILIRWFCIREGKGIIYIKLNSIYPFIIIGLYYNINNIIDNLIHNRRLNWYSWWSYIFYSYQNRLRFSKVTRIIIRDNLYNSFRILFIMKSIPIILIRWFCIREGKGVIYIKLNSIYPFIIIGLYCNVNNPIDCLIRNWRLNWYSRWYCIFLYFLFTTPINQK